MRFSSTTVLSALGLIGSSFLPACGGPDAVTADEAHLESVPTTLPSGAPLLRLPFEAGTVVLCQQGNDTGPGHSHSDTNTRFALDLSVPGSTDVPVVAAAAGKVIRIVTGSAPLAVSPGSGFGNQVAVEHPGGFISNYSHLARVDVAVGVSVRSGDPIGVMGNTGKAGNPHVHFSLHRVLPPTGDGLIDSVPMEGLLTADVTAKAGFALTASTALTCAPSIVSHAGHLYGSENRDVPPFVGPVPADLVPTITARGDAVDRAIDEAGGVHAIIEGAAGQPSALTLEQLSTWLAAHPQDQEARYWVVVFSIRVTPVDKERIRAELATLEAAAPTTPAWLGPWTLLRSAQFAILDGRLDDAREKLGRADAFADAQGEQYKSILASLRASLPS